MSAALRVLTGAALDGALEDVARLRIAVFRDWPYLYDGDLAYERDYLDRFRSSAGAVVVGAFEGTRLVGAATGAPLADHAEDFAEAFDDSGLNIGNIFYCAESVLLPEWRGQGLGHGFFDHREAHARRLGLSRTAFCSVLRPADHPLRPSDYLPLDGFWRRIGYRPLEGLEAEFSWRDIGETGESVKRLQVWGRDL